MVGDILLFETGNGGDISIQNSDIALSDPLLQQAYLCLFGGNVAADTLGNEIPSEVRRDWWGNGLLMADVPGQQFNSQTERALMNNTLNSTGRVNIIRAMEADLKGLKAFATVAVEAVLTTNRLRLMVTLTQPDNKQEVVLQILWDSVKSAVIIEQPI